MSAFDRLLAGSSGSATPSASSQTVNEPSIGKAEKRYAELSRRRANALSDAKGTARWWKFLEVMRKVDTESEETLAVWLRCVLCQAELSASNESRIATSHLKKAGCSKVKATPDLALEVLAAFGPAADSAASETAPDVTEEEALQQLDRKRKASQPLIKDVYLSKEKQEDLTMALYDFFLESSDCVAMHVCEHPALKKFCKLAGLPPLNRKRLAGPVLDKKYAETMKVIDDKLAKQPIGVQIGTDGWKRKNVNEAQKIQNFIGNFPDGSTQFLTAHNTEGVRMDNIEYERIFTQQIIALGERLGCIKKVLGCITDREIAVQVAFASLERKYHWMVNLVCQAHGFSLMIKDLLVEFPAVGKTSDTTIKISNFSGNHTWFRCLLHEFQKELLGYIAELVSQVETRFGTKVMVTQSVMRSAEALQKTVRDERYATKAAGAEFGLVIHGLVNDIKFISDMESSLKLLQPILAVLQSLEADKPLLSQCLPLWLSVFQHVKAWAAAELQQTATLEDVLLKRFKKCYHPAMSAAYLCDPAFYTYDADSEAYLANAKQVAEFEAQLHIDVWKDAKEVMIKIAGRQLSGKATIEMTMLQVNGMQELDTASELVKKTPSGTLGRSVFEHGIVVRRAVWSSKSSMGKASPTLSPVARRLLSLHATSAAPERNWSHWGRMYRKDRSSLALTRAEKLVAVSSAAKVANKDNISWEEKEMELMCTAVDESQFGTALVDCFLVAD